MKKVKCVDAGLRLHITNGKEYVVISEDDEDYEIVDNNGDKCHYRKRKFRPVPEQEFTYGQEVEVSDDGIGWKRTLYACLNPDSSQFKYLTSHGAFNYIRPIPSLRDKVRDYINSRTNVSLSEVELDRIIELVKQDGK